MSFEFDAPESTDTGGGGNFLSEPGTYHVLIEGVEPHPKARDGNLIADAMFKVNCCVLAGTVGEQAGKKFDFILFAPSASHKDGGELSRRKIFRCFDAISCLRVNGGKMRIEIGPEGVPDDHPDADKFTRGRQMVIEMDLDKKRSVDGKKFVQPAFANFYHVDDPAVAGVPKDEQALALLPPQLRRSPEAFAKKDGAAGGGTGGTAAAGTSPGGQTATAPPTAPPQQTQQQAPAAPAAPAAPPAAVSLDDI